MRPKMFLFLLALMLAAASAQAQSVGVFDPSRATVALGVDYALYGRGDGKPIGFSDSQEMRETAQVAWSMGKSPTSIFGNISYGNKTTLRDFQVGVHMVAVKPPEPRGYKPSLAVGAGYQAYDGAGARALGMDSQGEFFGGVYAASTLYKKLVGGLGVTYGARSSLLTYYATVRVLIFQGRETL